MKILIADDDAATRAILESFVRKWGYEPVSFSDGSAAMMELRKKTSPSVAILDWVMPGIDGIDICKRLREIRKPTYVILLSSKEGQTNLVEALDAGASDFSTKPINKEELRVRVQVGVRFSEMQEDLNLRLEQLEKALNEIQDLKSQLKLPV